MAEKSAVDVLNSHHTKLNQHSDQIAKNFAGITEAKAKIDELEKRVAALEADHKPFKEFLQRINDWVVGLKD